MTNNQSRGLAAQILQETAVTHPEILGQWVALRDVRDRLMHPFDRQRLRLTYKQGNSWDALKDAAKSLEWLEVRGEGLEIEVRAKEIPTEVFTSLEEAQDRINHLAVVFAHWKEIGHKLLLAEETIWNMREHIKASDERLMRSLALVFHYKVLANEYQEMLIAAPVHENLLRTIDPPSKETLDKMWKENPAEYGSLKLLLKDTGVLDDMDEVTAEEE